SLSQPHRALHAFPTRRSSDLLELDPKNKKRIEDWADEVRAYSDDYYSFTVRDREIKIKTYTESLAHSRIPKISLPKYEAWGDLRSEEHTSELQSREKLVCRLL